MLFSLFLTNILFPKLMLRSFFVQSNSWAHSIPLYILIPCSIGCNSCVAFRDLSAPIQCLKPSFCFRIISSPHIRFLNKSVHTFCHQEALVGIPHKLLLIYLIICLQVLLSSQWLSVRWKWQDPFSPGGELHIHLWRRHEHRQLPWFS